MIVSDPLQTWEDALLVASIFALILDIYSFTRLERLGDRLLEFNSNEGKFQDALQLFKAEMLEWSTQRARIDQAWAAECHAQFPQAWGEKVSLEKSVAELEVKAKRYMGYDFVDYDREPFPELNKQEGQLYDLRRFFGEPVYPPKPQPPQPSHAQIMRMWIAAIAFLGSCVLVYLGFIRISVEQWSLLALATAGKFFGSVLIALVQVFSPLVPIALLLAGLVYVSRGVAIVVGTALLGLARGLGRLAQSRVLHWGVRITAVTEVGWGIYKRLVPYWLV